jgi:hypothetical protein
MSVNMEEDFRWTQACASTTRIEAVLSALRPCARPPFAMERLHRHGPDHLLYHCPNAEPGGKCADLLLTPLELIDRIAALVPPPRKHRLRHFGVSAPNSPLREFVTAMVRSDSGTSHKASENCFCMVAQLQRAGALAEVAWDARHVHFAQMLDHDDQFQLRPRRLPGRVAQGIRHLEAGRRAVHARPPERTLWS